MKITTSWVGAVTLVVLSGAAQAALIDRGGGMVYDTTRNITWLADMNYARTSGYAAANAGGTGSNEIRANGAMGWDAAVAWADSLDYGGFSDWRLPTLNPADTTCTMGPGVGQGFNCRDGELSGLFVTDLGYNSDGSGLVTADDTAEQVANRALFDNLGSANNFWSGTAYAMASDWAWSYAAFDGPDSGIQRRLETEIALYALAVRSGDVATTVPEPQTLALVLLALGAGVAGRRTRLV